MKVYPSDDDQSYLRAVAWPGYEEGATALRLVDLFAGCGGLTLGVAEGARRAGFRLDVQLAIDFNPDAVEVFRHAFRKLDPGVVCAPIEEYFDGAFGAPPTKLEQHVAEEFARPPHLLVGGPPCQGHSDLNNHSRRDDPRNAYYGRMARAAEILRPDVVAVENVPSVRHDRDGIVEVTRNSLEAVGYVVADDVIDLHRLGVPQTRRRHLLLAVAAHVNIDPGAVLTDLTSREQTGRDVRWAIGDLTEVGDADRALVDEPSRVTAVNEHRIDYLTTNSLHDLPDQERPPCHRDGGHSYRSVYGRLWWDRPAQTITSGFGSMGQGRYVHPSHARTLTPHEAARIQFLPDWFDVTANGAVTRRTAWAAMIGNAVPPKLGIDLVQALTSAGWKLT